jgi:hypothetical protein
MPKFQTVPWNKFTKDQQQVLDKLQAEGVTINAEGDFKVGETVVTGSESRLVGGIVALGVAQGDKPVGADEREKFLATAQRLVRKLGVDRE